MPSIARCRMGMLPYCILQLYTPVSPNTAPTCSQQCAGTSLRILRSRALENVQTRARESLVEIATATPSYFRMLAAVGPPAPARSQNVRGMLSDVSRPPRTHYMHERVYVPTIYAGNGDKESSRLRVLLPGRASTQPCFWSPYYIF